MDPTLELFALREQVESENAAIQSDINVQTLEKYNWNDPSVIRWFLTVRSDLIWDIVRVCAGRGVGPNPKMMILRYIASVPELAVQVGRHDLSSYERALKGAFWEYKTHAHPQAFAFSVGCYSLEEIGDAPMFPSESDPCF